MSEAKVIIDEIFQNKSTRIRLISIIENKKRLFVLNNIINSDEVPMVVDKFIDDSDNVVFKVGNQEITRMTLYKRYSEYRDFLLSESRKKIRRLTLSIKLQMKTFLRSLNVKTFIMARAVMMAIEDESKIGDVSLLFLKEIIEKAYFRLN